MECSHYFVDQVRVSLSPAFAVGRARRVANDVIFYSHSVIFEATPDKLMDLCLKFVVSFKTRFPFMLNAFDA